MYIFYQNRWIKVDQDDMRGKALNIIIGEGAVDEKTKTIFIRIGCEIHTVEEWSSIKFQEKLADQHDRTWWEDRGRKILAFLEDRIGTK